MANNKKQRFRLTGGSHVMTNPAGGGEITIHRGEIIESDKDLTEIFPNKFELVGEGATSQASPPPGQLPPASDGLEEMTLKELQSFAAEEEVDLKGAKTKEDMIKAIRASIGVAHPAATPAHATSHGHQAHGHHG
jgi:hypothetical protein